MSIRLDEQFTYFEAICLFTLVFIYHIFSEVLPTMLQDLGPASWMTHVISGVLALGYLLLFMLLCKRHKDMEFLEICDAVYGKWLSKAVQVLLLAYLFFYASSALNQAVETLQLYDYSNMSAMTIDLLVMGAVAVTALYSVKGLAKTVSVFLPLVVVTIALILVLSRKQYDPDLLHPLFGYGVGVTVSKSFFHLSKYNGILMLAVVGGSFGSGRRFASTALWGILASTILFTAVNLCYAMAIPYSSAEDIQIGIIGLAQGNSNGRYLQRLESIYLAVNIMAILLLLSNGFLILKKIYCNLFGIQKQHARGVIIPLSMLVVCIARAMGTFDRFKWAVRYATRRYSGFALVGLIALTLLASLVRGWITKGRGPRAPRAALFVIPCLLIGLLSGCHYREPDSEIFPIVLGYDKGETEKYRITLQFMMEAKNGDTLEQKSEDSGEGEGIPTDIMVMETPSLDEGMQMLNTIMPRHISLLHIKALVVSEEIAREGVAAIVAPLVRDNNVKPTMSFIVSRCSAYDLITGKNPTLTGPAHSDLELVQEIAEQTTYYSETTLAEFLFHAKSTYGDGTAILGNRNLEEFPPDEEGGASVQALASAPVRFEQGYLAGELPVIGNREMELAGMAVFRDDKMVGELNTRESQTLAFLTGSYQNTVITFPDLEKPDEYYTALKVRKVEPVAVNTRILDDGRAEIRLRVVVNGQVGISQNPGQNYSNDPVLRERIAEYCSQIMAEYSHDLLKKLQNEYESDILQLGRKVARNFRTIQQWEAYDWHNAYKDADIQVDFEFQL